MLKISSPCATLLVGERIERACSSFVHFQLALQEQFIEFLTIFIYFPIKVFDKNIIFFQEPMCESIEGPEPEILELDGNGVDLICHG